MLKKIFLENAITGHEGERTVRENPTVSIFIEELRKELAASYNDATLVLIDIGEQPRRQMKRDERLQEGGRYQLINFGVPG